MLLKAISPAGGSRQRAPRYWRRITPASGLVDPASQRDWLLVLNARAIPFVSLSESHALHLFVPPVVEGIAQSEIRAFQAENARREVWPKRHTIYGRAWLAALPLGLLLPWYHITHGSGHDHFWWDERGSLKPAETFLEEARRSLTALTLHADYGHLVANLFFGCFFIFLLARICGWARALFLTILGGWAGNLMAIQLRAGSWQSIGYSTAVFASVGALGGIMAARSGTGNSRLIAPGAALALLSLLGTEGIRTDFLAHLCGLFCGVLFGFLAGLRKSRGWPGLCTMLLALVGAWFLAIRCPE